MYERIIVGTDGSPTAAKAVERAVSVAEVAGASLTIMTAASEKRGRKILDAALAAHADSTAEIETLVLDVDPVSGLIDAAREGGYDLVVVGNKGLTGPGRFFRLGGVPNKLSHHLPASLLIVRTT